MKIDDFQIRQASISDIPFLVETIIQAEKSGTNVLTWSTIFDISESDARKFLSAILLEEVDGCELSVSSFLVAEKNQLVVAALSAWVEPINEPSSQLKGNLLSYVLPKECIMKASLIHPIIKEINIDYIPGSIQKGAGYVTKEYRNMKLFGILTVELIKNLVEKNPGVKQAYTQIYSCNIPAIKANEKLGFNVVLTKESINSRILDFLPSNKKLLLKKDLI